MPTNARKKARTTGDDSDGDRNHGLQSSLGLVHEREVHEISSSGSDGDSHSDSNQVESAHPSPPPTVKKRRRGRKVSSSQVIDEEDATGSYLHVFRDYAHKNIEDFLPKSLTYILSILSAEEARKSVSKRTPVTTSLELSDKEPWDTMKAQLLMKIDEALSPHVLEFDGYTVMFYISRVLPKPGMVLATEVSYRALLSRAANLTSKTPTINLTIQEKQNFANKENEGGPGAVSMEVVKEKKKVCYSDFPCI